jgi:arylsulfatase A-like enzyme
LRRWSALVGLLVLVSGCTAKPAAEKDDRPNVLILVSDDERIESEAGRPYITKWFKGGTTFTHAFATTPQCCPSRASILTGQYAHNHDIHRKRDAESIQATHTLPYELKRSGYQTAFAGKYLNGWPDTRKPPYFDRWALGVGYNDRPFVVQGKKQRARYGPSFVLNLGQRDIERWEDDDDKPWFLMLAPSTPHDPYQPQSKYAHERFRWDGNPATRETDRSDKPPYVRRRSFSQGYGEELRQSQLRTLRSLDDEYRLLIKKLTDTGELERTIVIYVSDNGMMWAEHGLEGKGVPYLGSVRVPMAIRGPGIAKGKKDDNLVGNIDIAPTIYKLLGIKPGYTTDGRDLLTSKRRALLLEFEGGGSIPKWWSLVTKRWQYIRYGSGVTEFYDLERDPYELDNDPSAATIEETVALSGAQTCAGAARCP